MTKYIASVYKILSSDDEMKLFIGSTNENINNLLTFYLQDIQTTKKSKLYNWLRTLNKQFIKIKIIKSYPVLSIEEQEKREKYWVEKYKTYGYNVIHKEYVIKPLQTNEVLYVCFKNISMEEIINRYGENVVSISKNKTDEIKHEYKPIQKTIVKNTKSEDKKSNISVNTGGFMDELKNVLSKNSSISTILKKNKKDLKKPVENNNQSFLEELKSKIKKI